MVSITKDLCDVSMHRRLLALSAFTNMLKVLVALTAILILDKHTFGLALTTLTVMVGWLLSSVVVNGMQSLYLFCAAIIPDNKWLRWMSTLPCVSLLIFVLMNGIWVKGGVQAFTLGCILYVIMIIYTHSRELVLGYIVKALRDVEGK